MTAKITFTQEELKTTLELHRKWLCGEGGGARADLSRADLSRADLSRANLSGANLSEANLSEANLWVTQWPLWCGTKKVRIDLKIAYQLAAHFCTCECDEPEFLEAKKALMPLARKSHVAKELEIE